MDQQIYPLLEICRYYEVFKDSTIIQRLGNYIEETLQMIMMHRDENKWLFKTGETPADDKVDFPYHFSSQVLLWYTLEKLESLKKQFNFTQMDLKEIAGRVKHDCLEGFTAEKNAKIMFAYLTDLNGGFQFYHDANDLPTVLAPLWNFCRLKMKFGTTRWSSLLLRKIRVDTIQAPLKGLVLSIHHILGRLVMGRSLYIVF